MKKILIVLLALLSSIIFILFALLSLKFHFDYLYYYEFYTTDSVVASIVWVAILIVISILFVLLLRFACKTEKTVASIALLVALIIGFAYLSTYSFFALAFGYNGCDYTEDIANYDRFGANLKYFPEEITDDFEVVDYSYYHTLLDTDHTEIYLEVRFDNLEVMEKYLLSAITAFDTYGVQEYQNPFNPTYTDIVADTIAMQRGSGETFSAYIDCDSYQKHRYTEAYYRAISYSYEELSIIYVYLDMGSDISIDHYYPKYLRRFDVEWNSDIDFYVKYEKIN